MLNGHRRTNRLYTYVSAIRAGYGLYPGWIAAVVGGGMSNESKVLELFKRKGVVTYDEIRRATRVKNPPDVVHKLRRKGRRIESIWEEKNGKRHVCAYRYYSKTA